MNAIRKEKKWENTHEIYKKGRSASSLAKVKARQRERWAENFKVIAQLALTWGALLSFMAAAFLLKDSEILGCLVFMGIPVAIVFSAKILGFLSEYE